MKDVSSALLPSRHRVWRRSTPHCRRVAAVTTTRAWPPTIPAADHIANDAYSARPSAVPLLPSLLGCPSSTPWHNEAARQRSCEELVEGARPGAAAGSTKNVKIAHPPRIRSAAVFPYGSEVLVIRSAPQHNPTNISSTIMCRRGPNFLCVGIVSGALVH